MRTWLVVMVIAAVAACGAPGRADDPTTSATQQALSSIVANGSFETGDYTGWTLQEQPTSPTSGTWGIATDGDVIQANQSVFDFADQTNVQEFSPGLPFTYRATDGTKVAFQLQNGGQDHRMFQTIALPACQPLLLWDMAYNNHSGGFDPNNQVLAVRIRNPADDSVLATPFQTNAVDPLVVPAMTAFQADLTAFSGQTVRLDYEMIVNNFFFDAEFDDIRVICKGISASPGTLDFGTVPQGGRAPRVTTVTNFAATSLSLQSLGTTGPYAITNGPSLPLALAPSQSTTVEVTFQPTTAGTLTGALTLHSTDPNGDTVVQLTGVGTGAPHLDAQPGTVAFGGVQVGQPAVAQDVTLQNTGNSALTLTAANLPAPFSVTGLVLPLTLAPGDQVTAQVGFAPTAATGFTALLTLTSNDPASPTVVTVTGTGVGAKLDLSATALAFGGQRVATTSAPQSVRATNNGIGPVTISAAATTGAFAVAPVLLPLTLPPGQFTDIAVTFAPTAEGPASGQLRLTSTADGSPQTVALTGAGIAPHITASPTPVQFGNQHLATTGQQTVIVTNTGTDTLTVSGVAAAAPFGDADATPIQIAPNASALLTVTFQPTVSGPSSGTLTLASDDAAAPSLALPLAGTGVIGQVAIAPGAVHFADQRIHTTSAGQTVTVTNTGTDTLTLGTITTAAPFAVAGAFTHALPPGASTQVTVAFTPTSVGAAGGSLQIASDAPSSPDVVPLSGAGVQPLATATPTSLAFGNQRVGTTSAGKTFALANPGTQTLTVTALAASAGFTTTGPALPFLIPPGQSTTLGVAFAPTASGLLTGSVAITTDAATDPTVTLRGTGIEPLVTPSPAALAFGTQRIGTTSAAQTVTLTNSGTAPLAISGFTAPPGFIVTPTAFPVTVLPGGHAKFTVKFAPATASIANGPLVVTSDAAASPTTIALTGTGVQALVAATPPSHDFGDILVGATSNPITITLTNPGSDAYKVTSIALPAPFVRTAMTLPATIAPNGSLSFDVTFKPTAHVAAVATVSIATDAGFSGVVLTGRGVAPLLTATPTPLAFGAIALGQSATLTLALANPGDAPLTVSGVDLAGANAADFVITNGPALPATIAAGTALSLSVVLTPADHGVRSAQLTATSDALGAPTVVIPFSGRGQGPDVSVAPDVLAFGASNVGVTPAAKVVTVSNDGETALVVSAITLSGATTTDFATTAALPLTVAPGDTATVSFTFTPSAVGARAATATFVTNDTLGTPPTVALSGVGESPMIQISASTLAFGAVRVGATSTLPLTISNPGSGPLTLTQLTLSGPDAATLSLDALTLPLVLAPGGSRAVHVTFAPTVLASAAGTLTVLSDDPATPSVAVPITGAGVSPTVALDPATLDFGGQLVGHTSASRTVHVHNTGTGALAVTALAITGAQAAAFTLPSAPSLPASIGPGGTLDVKLAVAPTAAADLAADLEVTTDSPDAPNAVAHLTALGISTALAVTPTSIAFGTVHAGAAAPPIAVTLTNLTSDPITLTDGVLGGGRPQDYTVSAVAGVLAPGATATAMIAYAPAAAAQSAATVTFASTDPAIPSAIVTLDGRAVSAFLTVDHMTVDFGSIDTGDHSGPKAVAATNTTTAMLTIQSITSADPQFTVDVGSALAPLAPGASTAFTLTFAPTAAGSATASVAITLAGARSPEVIVTATGTGIGAPSDGCSAGGGSPAALVLVALGLVMRRRRLGDRE